MQKICKYTVLFFIIILLSPLSVTAKEVHFEDMIEDSVVYSNYNIDGTLKIGFVEENPWDNGFKSIYNISSDEITIIEVYSEEKAQQVFEDIEKMKHRENYDPSNFINKDENTNKVLRASSLQSKAWYRAQFKTLALTAGTLNLPTAGNYLYHSLQDNPTNRTNNIGSGHANALSLTKMYTTISVPMATAIKKANREGKTYVGGNSSIQTTVENVGLDFYLTYGALTYSWGASKLKDGSWAVNIVIYDTYDYLKIKKINRPFPYNLIDLANNHAADAQTAGAIVPYTITNLFYHNYRP